MTGSQGRESFTHGQISASPSNTRGKSRMHQGARTDPCGGRGATHVPTATEPKYRRHIQANCLVLSSRQFFIIVVFFFFWWWCRGADDVCALMGLPPRALFFFARYHYAG